MEKSLIHIPTNEIYVTHAEYKQGFIKIWANAYTKKRSNMEKCLQDYTSFSKEFTKLDLYGHSMYIYVWKTNYDYRVYRCQVLQTDLIKKTLTIILTDYGQQIVTPYCNVREVTKDLDISIINSFSQRPLLDTFFLSEYISKQKSNNDLSSTLCNKYYKYIVNFLAGGMRFVTLFDIDKKKLIESNLAECITVEAMHTIANANASSIQSMNSNDSLNSISIPNKTMVSFLKYQSLDYVTPIDVAVTSVDSDKTSILLTVRILDHDSEAINKILNSLDRHNLRLAPVVEVYTPCLIVLRNKIVRAIILEVKIDTLFIALVDYGIRETIPRTAVFEVPPKCDLIEMRSLNVVLDKPKSIIINENMFAQKYFQMLPLRMDPNYGLYKVQLLKKVNGNFIDVFNDMCINENCLKPSQSPELFSITEIQDELESLENAPVMNTMSFNYSRNNQIEKKNMELMEDINVNLKKTETVNQIEELLNINWKNQIEEKDVELIENKNVNLKKTETVNQIDKPITINRTLPIDFLRKDSLNDAQEIIGSLIYYKSPFNFRIRQFNPNFEPFMDQIKSSLNSRCILTQNELVINMYVICQKKKSDSIYRSQIIDMDSEVEKIKFLLVDEGDEIINEHYSNITLYNFIESDGYLPGQLVLDCALNNMWFPVMNIDTIFLLQPYFSKKQLYKVLIIDTIECGVKLVQMIIKDTNIDVSDVILQSGIGQRLLAAMKTDECPYEEKVFKGQSFLSYIYDYHFKMCIQPEPNTVDELEEEIEEYLNKNPNPGPLDVGNLHRIKYCLATISNNQWHRACIKIINEDSITVNMFDIGLITDVSYEQIQPITSDLMKKPQLCLNCYLETKELTFKLTEKMLYNVTVKSVDPDGKLCVTVKEHNTVPLSNPIVRSIEKISHVHIDGDLTYLQRSQDKLKAQKLSVTLSKMNGKSESKSIVPGDMAIFESHGMYYRCVVKSINSKMFVVYCIDFGYEKQVEEKKLQFLGCSKIALLPALVTIVKTFPMAFNMSKTIFLANMLVDNNGALNAMPNKMSSIQTQNELMETLQKKCLVKVSCVNSSDECWIVPHLFLDRLKSISNILIKMQSKMIPAVTEPGSLCAAQNTETKKWHRALILDKDKSTKNVLLIDSGEQIKVTNTTKLTGEVQKIPNCALRCKAISNVPIKNLLNKDVECQLISCNQSLLEIELFSNVNEITSTQLGKEWTVVVCKFESFNKFYVLKIEKKNHSANVKSNNLLTSVTNNSKDLMQRPHIGSIIETLTDKGDGVWYMAEVVAPYDSTNVIVRLLDDGSICKSTKIKYVSVDGEKLTYRCYLEDYSDDDELTNDPSNFDYILKIMMSHEWIMKTFSDEEPFKVNLTLNGVGCIDVLYKLMNEFYHEYVANESVSFSDQYESSVDELTIKDSLLEENPKNQIAKKNNTFNDLAFPGIETVTIKNVETHKCFYAKSESLFTLYMERINSEMDMCIVQLPMNSDIIGSIVVMNSESLQRWCRARVHEISSNGSATCYLLDDGVYDICDKFYKPTDFLKACPPIVRCCSLYTPKLAGKEDEIWFPDVDDMFKDIISIKGIKFDMIIKEDRVYQDSFLVTLILENADISEMLVPLNVQVTYINSLTDFKIKAISDELIFVTKSLESSNFLMVIEENPVIGNLYLAEYKNKIIRVKYDGRGGLKYVVVDIDDTLDNLSVDKLYEIPECFRNIPPFSMPCSLILHDKQEMYSEELFKRLVDKKLVFIMCIISENDCEQPNFVKLYHDDQDVLNILKVK